MAQSGNASRARNDVQLRVELLEDRLTPSVAAPDHLYTFADGLADAFGGPSLVGDGGVVTEGRYVFGPNQGLALTGGLADPANFSVIMELELDSLEPFYKKLLDFQNRNSDTGLYVSGDQLQLYPGDPGLGTVSAETDFQVAITRDGTTGNTSLYLNGVLQQVYTGTTSDVAVTWVDMLRFFEDDHLTDFEEAGAGSADFIAVYDRVLSAAEVAAIAAGATTLRADQAQVSVVEGNVAANSGVWDDANFDPIALTASVGVVTQNSDGTWSWSYGASDGPVESQTVTITARDAAGVAATATFDLLVQNAPPRISALSSIVSGGRDVELRGFFTDNGVNDTHTVVVNWGDGSAPETLTDVDPLARSFAGLHRYASPGSFTIVVEVIDKDGAADSATTSVSMAGISVVDGVLYVVGTDGHDFIHIRSHTSGGRGNGETFYTVLAYFDLGTPNARFERLVVPAREVRQIMVLGGDGNDVILVDNQVQAAAHLFGGEGFDFLHARRTALVRAESFEWFNGRRK